MWTISLSSSLFLTKSWPYARSSYCRLWERRLRLWWRLRSEVKLKWLLWRWGSRLKRMCAMKRDWRRRRWRSFWRVRSGVIRGKGAELGRWRNWRRGWEVKGRSKEGIDIWWSLCDFVDDAWNRWMHNDIQYAWFTFCKPYTRKMIMLDLSLIVAAYIQFKSSHWSRLLMYCLIDSNEWWYRKNHVTTCRGKLD